LTAVLQRPPPHIFTLCIDGSTKAGLKLAVATRHLDDRIFPYAVRAVCGPFYLNCKPSSPNSISAADFVVRSLLSSHRGSSRIFSRAPHCSYGYQSPTTSSRMMPSNLKIVDFNAAIQVEGRKICGTKGWTAPKVGARDWFIVPFKAD
jgi:hypothetical protein